MSLTSVGGSSNSPLLQPSTQSNWLQMLSSLSGTLNMTPTALQQQLKAGSSLSSVADVQGVSQQTLVQSISTALTQYGSSASGSQLAQIATNIAERTGNHHPTRTGAAARTERPSASTLTSATGSRQTSSSAGGSLDTLA
jgi:hypothetical protein